MKYMLDLETKVNSATVEALEDLAPSSGDRCRYHMTDGSHFDGDGYEASRDALDGAWTEHTLLKDGRRIAVLDAHWVAEQTLRVGLLSVWMASGNRHQLNAS